MKKLEKIKAKVRERSETDKIMWFSMWFLVSIVTFGLAFFPMFYYLIERRSQHFSRQREFKRLTLNFLKSEIRQKPEKKILPPRNSKLWSASIILIFPIFWIAYFLSKDLIVHERREKIFFRKVLPHREYHLQHINIKKYLLLTLATFGIGIIYWLYKLFNLYNNHFHSQRVFEDEITDLIQKKLSDNEKISSPSLN